MEGDGPIGEARLPKSAQPPLDREIAELAARQHGVVSLAQLERRGLSRRAAAYRVTAWRLQRVYRGVYLVGHSPMSTEGRWMAAVLACGPGAVLASRSAADLLGLRRSARPGIDVIAPRRAGRSVSGIDSHRPGGLTRGDVTTVRGIRCTTVPRTLLDLAEVIDRTGLERACDRAEILGLFHLDALRELLARSDGRSGAPKLRALLGEHYVGPTLTRSELEDRFLALCAGAGISRPRCNAWLPFDDAGMEVDFLWPAERLVVETDGHAAHGSRMAFERDRARDQRLVLAGYRVVRFTWRQIRDDAGRVAATVQALVDG